jgi:GTP cyclohydrolase I
VNKKQVEVGVRHILEGLLGKEWSADHNYEETPARVARFYAEFFRPRNYQLTSFPEKYDQMIVVAHHQDWTLCPHHLLPVSLDISLAYIPNGAVLGLSKLARLVQNHFTEPLLQEELTESIVHELMTKPAQKPLGAACLIFGRHACMQIRGPKTQGYAITSAFKGAFLDNPAIKAEFLALVRPR